MTVSDDLLPLFRALVARAVLAPSSHNTQPWVFRAAPGDTLELLADRSRALAVNDPHDRELTISCGCALFNLRVAAAAHRIAIDVARLPDAGEPDLLARLRPTGGVIDPSLPTLDEAIAHRRTWRRRFTATVVSAEVIATLADVAATEGAWLSVLASDSARAEAAALVAEGDRLQWDNPSWRRELAAWMHPRRRGDGLSLPALAAPLAQAVVRSFDMGRGVAAKDSELASESPLLAVVGTRGDGPADWLAAGEALQRVLLTACRAGLQASYLNQPVQMASLRTRLQRLADTPGTPQLLLRLGYADGELPPAPRRLLEDVIETTDH